MLSWIDWLNLLLVPGLLIGFTVHELGHALTAYYLGDYSQAEKGRITANPVKHISWIGGLLFITFGFGWPKPINFNPKNFKHQSLDTYLVSLAGPCANFLVSLLFFILTLVLMWVLRLTQQIDPDQFSTIMFFNRNNALASLSGGEALQEVVVWVIAFSNRVWVVNFVLAVISLIPLPPFDGFTIILSLFGLIREKRIQDLRGDDAVDEPVMPTASAAKEPAQPLTRSLLEQTSVEADVPVNKKQSMAEIHFKFGTEYHSQQKFDDAIARYRQAIENDAHFGPAYVNMGLAFKAKGHRQEAIHAFRAATRYAQDEKAKSQAWAELHELSALPNINPEIPTTNTDSGATPWTDTKPAPDWIMFGIGAAALFLFFFCIFGFFLVSMMA